MTHKYVGLVYDKSEIAIIYYDTSKYKFYANFFDFDGLNLPSSIKFPNYDNRIRI